MQFAHAHLQKVLGLSFYKLMGSGKEFGFNPLPDWEVYSLLAVWEDEKYALSFYNQHSLFQQYKEHTSEQWTLFLRTRQAKGLWSGGNPFSTNDDLDKHNPYYAVITRATIRWQRLIDFWRYVPISQRPIQNGLEGLIYTKGIGEVPFLQMATFSLWTNYDALKKFAYQSKDHQIAIDKTRQLDWYSEEMFARFQPYRSVGTWGGKTMLPPFHVDEF